MRIWIKKSLGLCAVLTICVMALCSCGKEISVSIVDGGVTTETTAKSGTKVQAILNDAGITTGDRDEVEPGLEEAMKEDGTITIARFAEVTVVDGDREYPLGLVGATVADAIRAAGLQWTEQEYLDEGMKPEDLLKDGMTINVRHYLKVTLVQSGVSEEKLTSAATVADFLKENGLEVTADTIVTPDASAAITDGMTVTVASGVKVSVTVDGTVTEMMTSAKTVADFLASGAVKLGENDRVSADPTTAITDGMELVIQRVEMKEEVVKESISYSSSKQETSSLNSGETSVKQSGQKGEAEVTYQVVYVDGVEESRSEVSRKVVKEPVNEIILVGVAQAPAPDPDPTPAPADPDPAPSDPAPSDPDPVRTIVSQQYFDDCDGSGHGICIITYSDGTTEEVPY